jgi:SAM-dependent methyltransferase
MIACRGRGPPDPTTTAGRRHSPTSRSAWSRHLLDGEESRAPAYIRAVSFDVAADAYDRFMGRYSQLLSAQLADLASIRHGQRVLDVGCGTGALTDELVERLGPGAVAAVDPSEPFVAATRSRHPGVEVRQAAAERLPFPDRVFDAALAQLVVHFMPDPVAGLVEMARVTRLGGVVAASVWDHAGGRGPLRLFWGPARSLDPDVDDESRLPGTREGELAALFESAGLRDIEARALSVSLEHPTFEAWWKPFTRGVGPAGAYLASLDADRREALREACRRQVPGEPFVVTGVAWAARGLV